MTFNLSNHDSGCIKNQSFCVIGAGGFIGSHLVDALLGEGCHVKALSRNMPGLLDSKALQNPRLSALNVDIRNATALIDAVKGSHYVVHLASSSLPQSSNLNPQDDILTNLIGSLNVIDACISNKVKKLIYISSGGTIYGNPLYVPIDEFHPTNPSCSYGINKLATEKYLNLNAQLNGLNYVVLRLANPYGERQRLDTGQGVVPVFLRKAIHSEPLEVWGDGTVVRDFLYISDVIRAIILSCKYCGSERIFNIGSGSGLSLNQLISLIEGIIGSKLNVVYKKSRDFDVPANVLSIQKAFDHLGWIPTVSPENGLNDFYQYLLHH